MVTQQVCVGARAYTVSHSQWVGRQVQPLCNQHHGPGTVSNILWRFMDTLSPLHQFIDRQIKMASWQPMVIEDRDVTLTF